MKAEEKSPARGWIRTHDLQFSLNSFSQNGTKLSHAYVQLCLIIRLNATSQNSLNVLLYSILTHLSFLKVSVWVRNKDKIDCQFFFFWRGGEVRLFEISRKRNKKCETKILTETKLRKKEKICRLWV